MALQELVDFKAEAMKAMKGGEYLEALNEARILANRDYTAAELNEHQEQEHQTHPTEYDEQRPTREDLFGHRSLTK
jgi:hypothetical protein